MNTPKPSASARGVGSSTQRVQEHLTTDRWRSSVSIPEPELAEPIDKDQEVEAAVNQANADIHRVSYSQDYRLSAKIRQSYLQTQRERLQSILRNAFSPLDEVQHNEICLCLARVLEELGEYQKAEDLYETLYPRLLDWNAILLPGCSWPGERHKNRALTQYVGFLARTSRKLKFAETLARVLPWASPFPLPDLDKRNLLLDTIHILTAQSNHLEASKHMAILHTLSFNHLKAVHDELVVLQTAIIEAIQGHRTQAQKMFIESLTLSSTLKGAWHGHTLNILYHFGKALQDWDCHEGAVIVLKECCLGSIYTFGIAHPQSQRAFVALKECKGSQSCLKALHRFGQADYSRKRELSVAYEHIHLNTAMDLLEHLEAYTIDYGSLITTLEEVLISEHSEVVDVYARRMIALCKCKLEQPEIALAILGDLAQNIRPGDRNALAVRLENVMCLVSVQDAEQALRMSKAIFHWFGDETYVIPKGQVQAIHRSLISGGVTHFTHNILAEHPPLISEENSEILGTGAFALVDSIKIGRRLFARKSIMLPRYNQETVRNAVQNEILVIRTLDHPHIIRVHLTYEDRSRFYIVMRPLADCDLEAFLVEHTQKPPTRYQKEMVWKWLVCLSNTLAFIHAQGIRHRDIKTRNILVKGEKIIFADFGSSHAFPDEDNSTTEGPAFGHTKIYCAPEVMANEKRGRSADIFSLGCVFTELAVWLAGTTIADWIKERETVIDGVTTIAYSATLDRIKTWFSSGGYRHEAGLLYELVIRFMLTAEDPRQRPTAVETSCRVLTGYQNLYAKAMQKCPKCNMELWVDDIGYQYSDYLSRLDFESKD